MLINQDLLDKLNIQQFKDYLFSINFILNSTLWLRLSYIKKENDLRFINLLYGFEFWGNTKVILKKIGFFYKIRTMVIEVFFKITVMDFNNWFFYWKFFLIPTSKGLSLDNNFKITLYNKLLTLNIGSLDKLQVRFRFLKNKNVNLVVLFKFFNILFMDSVYMLILTNLVKTYNLYDDYLIWSICL